MTQNKIVIIFLSFVLMMFWSKFNHIHMTETFEDLAPVISCLEIRETHPRLILKHIKTQEEIILPKECLPYITHFQSGWSIKSLLQKESQLHHPINFDLIIKTLDGLSLLGVFKNENHFEEYLNGVRKKQEWRESTVKENVFTCELFPKIRVPFKSKSFSIIISLFFIFISFFGLYELKNINIDLFFYSFNELHLFSILTIYLLFSFLLTFKTLIKTLILIPLQGILPSFLLRINSVGIYIDVQDNENVSNPSWNHFLIYVSHILSPFIGFFLLLFYFNDVSKNLMFFFFAIFLITEWAPFSKGELTKLLTFFYNIEIQSPKESSFQKWFDKKRDSIILTTHIFLFCLWIIFFTFIFIVALYNVIDNISIFTFSNMILLCWLTLLLFGSINSELYLSSSYRNSFKLWKLFWKKKKNIKSPEPFKNNKEYTFLETLKRYPPFNQMEEKVVKLISENCFKQTFSKGKIICREKEKSRDMYLLLEGRVSVYRTDRLGKKVKVASFGPGSIFGEIAFFTGKPRTADIIASEDIELLCIKYQNQHFQLDQPHFKIIQDRIWLMQTLLSSPLFAPLSSESLQVFIGHGQIKDVGMGQCLIAKGDPSQSFYILIQGTVSVYQDQKKIRTLSTGAVFGEIGLLYHIPRTASVVTDTPCKFLILYNKEFWRILSSNFSIALFLDRLARKRLHSDITGTSAT